jgi:hypothetical protein
MNKSGTINIKTLIEIENRAYFVTLNVGLHVMTWILLYAIYIFTTYILKILLT